MKKLILVGIAIISTTTLFAQTDLFGRKIEQKSTTETVTNSAAPQLLQGERKISGTESATTSDSQLESREQSAPTFLHGSASGRTSGFTMMQATGYGFGTMYGIIASPRIGYLFENGLYLGGSYQFNFGSNPFNPTSMGIVSDNATMQVGTFEIGYEKKLQLFGTIFYNRTYLALGMANVNLNGLSATEVQGINARQQNASALPQAGWNLFGTAGNLFYYRFQEFPMVRGLTLGLDARYMILNQASAFGLFFTTGIRLF